MGDDAPQIARGSVPVEYERDDSRRLNLVTVTEPYYMDDFLNAIDRLASEGTRAYATSYDVRALTTLDLDLRQLADSVPQVGRGRDVDRSGSLYVLAPSSFGLV